MSTVTATATAHAPAVGFDPRFTVERVDGVGVFLVSEDASAVLGEPIHLALQALLDGTRSADEVAEALADRFSALETYHALDVMTAKGYLACADDVGGSAAQDAYWALAGVKPSDAERDLARHRSTRDGPRRHRPRSTGRRAGRRRAHCPRRATTER